jgi:hypothetical protein
MKLKVMYQSICLLLKRNLFIDPALAEVKVGEDAERGLDRVRSPASAWGWRQGIASVAGLE